MNTKTARQIEEMKKQTIGVEIEMNSISRSKGCEACRTNFSEQADTKTQPTETATDTWSAWDEQGQRVEIPKGCQHCRN